MVFIWRHSFFQMFAVSTLTTYICTYFIVSYVILYRRNEKPVLSSIFGMETSLCLGTFNSTCFVNQYSKKQTYIEPRWFWRPTEEQCTNLVKINYFLFIFLVIGFAVGDEGPVHMNTGIFKTALFFSFLKTPDQGEDFGRVDTTSRVFSPAVFSFLIGQGSRVNTKRERCKIPHIRGKRIAYLVSWHI